MSRAAGALTYGTAYMTSWSGCDQECSEADRLSYADDQILLFEAEMNAAGHRRTHRYTNAAVWASDYIEDQRFKGEDDVYSDDGDVYAYSGHGLVSTNRYGQTLFIPTCHRGRVSSCWFDAEHSRFGERSGTYSVPNPGNMRFMIYATCFSAHEKPHEQWGQSLHFGTDVVMGYRGLSADSWATDEVLEDLATEAFADSESFKAAWFYAVEDWSIDDVGEIMTSGSTSSNAAARLDRLSRRWARRSAGDVHSYFAWAWHEG